MIEREYRLFADYFQFHIMDAGSGGIDGDTWTDAAFEAKLALERDAFAVGTARNMDVPVVVAILDGAPDPDVSAWDHVVEFSFEVPSGVIVIAGCTDYLPDAERMVIQPGHYAARVLHANLDRLSADGLDGDDHYRVELWQGGPIACVIRKQQADAS